MVVGQVCLQAIGNLFLEQQRLLNQLFNGVFREFVARWAKVVVAYDERTLDRHVVMCRLVRGGGREAKVQIDSRSWW